MTERLIELLEECLLVIDEDYDDLIEEIEDVLKDLRSSG